MGSDQAAFWKDDAFHLTENVKEKGEKVVGTTAFIPKVCHPQPPWISKTILDSDRLSKDCRVPTPGDIKTWPETAPGSLHQSWLWAGTKFKWNWDLFILVLRGKLTRALKSQYWLQLVLGPTAEGGSKDRPVHNLCSLDGMRNLSPVGKTSKVWSGILPWAQMNQMIPWGLFIPTLYIWKKTKKFLKTRSSWPLKISKGLS